MRSILKIYSLLFFFSCFHVGVCAISASTLVLRDGTWNLEINPGTLKMIATNGNHEEIVISAPTKEVGEFTILFSTPTSARWHYSSQEEVVDVKFRNNVCFVQFHSWTTGRYTWPRVPVSPMLQALIWPHNEGHYIPVQDTAWLDYLQRREWDTMEALSLPFWGLELNNRLATYIVTNPFHNQIQFPASTSQIFLEFTHSIPPNLSEREYGFEIHLTSKRSPVDSAKIFREFLIRNHKLVTLQEKAKSNPRINRLIGAPHAYLWGGGLLSQYDVPAKQWPLLCKKIMAESTSPQPTMGKHIKSLMKVSDWVNLEEMARAQTAYVYLQREVSRSLSDVITHSQFYNAQLTTGLILPKEAGRLLSFNTHDRTLEQAVLLNCYLFQNAYSDYVGHVETWGDGISSKLLKSFKEVGLEKMMLCLDGWEWIEKKPQVAKTADELGYLMGIYDSYHSIHDPKLAGTDASWATAQFDQALYETGGILNAAGKKVAGFKKQGYRLSPLAARPYVETRVTRNMNLVPYSYYFVDCDAFGEYQDDYTPGRSMTQRQDVEARIARLGWIKDTFHVPIGSEGGNFLFASVVDVAEGIFSPVIGWGDPDMKDKDSPYYLGRYYPPEGPEVFVKQVPLKDTYLYFHYDPRFRLPLYETVFHDCVVTSPHWSTASLKFSNAWKTNALTGMLYQVPPLYHLNQELFAKYKTIILQHYRYFSPLHARTGFLPITDFQWISEDRLLQKAVFGGEWEIIANYSDSSREYKGLSIPANSVAVPINGSYQYYTP